uniref:Maturase K n=1 Tax=Cosmarium botrytis TaxID=33101 RepID=A0A191T5H0_9VIRI|nr:maturase K [Cosmarium botrytis]ANI25640.1 maturase K [Cosmarium botrytis]
MKDSREKLIKRFLCAKTNTKSFKADAPLGSLRENKLYFFLLHEDFYPVLFQNTEEAYGPFEKSSYVLRKNNIKKYPKGFSSFLTIKYVIFLFRSNQFSDLKRSFFSHTRFYEQKKYENYLQRKKKSIFYLIVESITFLLLCSQQKKSANAVGPFGSPSGIFEKNLLRTKHISISIHKPLASIENQWQYYSFGLEGSFCRFFHPEVLIRILRKKIQDISFLHLIRNFLHSNLYLSDANAPFNSFAPFTKIKNILWNIYVLEVDNFFLTDCKYYSTSDKWIDASSNSSLSCFQKMKELTYFVPKEKKKDLTEAKVIPYKVFHTSTICNSEERGEEQRKISFLAQSSTYKYLRTNTSWFLFLQKEKSWNCFIKRRIIQFFNRRLGYIFSKNTINRSFVAPSSIYNQAEGNSYFFLAYILQFTKKINFVKVNTKLFFLINYFVKRVVSFINPFYLIILILSKQNFCNSVGYPKSKSGWVTWTDIDIIQHFNRIINSIFLFYSGCNNKKALSRLQYILHLSCAKTLACKHKTNLRKISKKFGNSFRNKDFSKEPSIFFVSNQSKNYRLRSFFRNKKMSRVWNFHLTQMDSIIFHLEDFSTLLKI